MPNDETRLLLLRHGRSEWNAVRRWQGSFDSPLDHVGRRQAATVATALANIDVSWHGPFASSLSRAAETAAIIAQRLGLPTPQVDHRLVEAHAGRWEGLTPDEIERQYPGWLADHRRPADFEPYESVVSRTAAALDDVVAAAGSAGATAIVVSHSGVIRSIVRSLGVPDTRIPNLGGVWLRPSASGATGFQFDEVFDPHGIVLSGTDAPGEDPGET